ncbi:MAG: SPFH domain-containing protein [Bacteroidales bacterium]|nr:SPFH domain-containing protein [Clostridium sp.]MCM1204159.1 SPFH domain-containing protein [Bacteroidales bacterium]
MNTELKQTDVTERLITKANGMGMLFFVLCGYLLCIAGYIACGFAYHADAPVPGTILLLLATAGIIVFSFMWAGFHIVNPNEAIVLTLFGNYYGTIRTPGYYHTNPFAACIAPEANEPDPSSELSIQGKEITTNINLNILTNKKISLKTMTLNNRQQKVNDKLGNPIIIGAVVIWKIVDPTKAVFNVDNYRTFLSIQCDSTIRKITRLYPYDLLEENENEEEHERTLRSSSQEIAEFMRSELQQRVEEAGIEVKEVRITHLAYSEEIAAAMLQKQQATAVIAARRKIVEGAVGMVDLAIKQLGEEEIVVLDEERKAAMVSNLLVVLCGNKEAQPVVNSSSIY